MKKDFLLGVIVVILCTIQPLVAQIDVPRCPVKIGDRVILDSKTPIIGDAACDALRDADKLADGLNKGVKFYQDQATKNIEDLNEVMFKEAIDKEALKKFNRAANAWNSIANDINDLAEDDVCGVEASFKKMNSVFKEHQAYISSVAEIANETLSSLKLLQPVLAEAKIIAEELNKIASVSSQKSPEAKKQFDIIKKSIDGVIKDLTSIAALDGQKLLNDGKDLATSVGPFIGNCATCAGVIGSATASLVGGSTAAVAGAGGCPETAAGFGGTCWGTVLGAPAAALSATLGTVASDAACQNVAGSVANANKYYNEINNFVSSAFSLSQSVLNNIEGTVDASNALAALAKELGNDAQGSVNTIQQSMDKITDAFQTTHKTVVEKVQPRIVKLGDNMISNLAKNVQHLKGCYEQYISVAGMVTPQALKAVQNLVSASATLLNSNQVLENMSKQANKAVEAASKNAQSKYDNVQDRFSSLHVTLFGQKPVRDFTKIDLGKATGSIASLATDERKRDRAFDKAENLVKEIVGLVAGAVKAGEDAFLNRDRLTFQNNVKSKFKEVDTKATEALSILTQIAKERVNSASESADDPKEEAKKAAIAKAKRKAQLEMKRKAMENNLKTIAEVKLIALNTPKLTKQPIKFKK